MKLKMLKLEPVYEPTPGGDVCAGEEETLIDKEEFLNYISTEDLRNELKKRDEDKQDTKEEAEYIIAEVFIDSTLCKISSKGNIYVREEPTYGHSGDLRLYRSGKYKADVTRRVSEIDVLFWHIVVYRNGIKHLELTI